MSREKTQTFQMRVSPGWLSRIDDWRRRQDDIPSRAETIRQLTSIALEGIPAVMAEIDRMAGSGDPKLVAKAQALRDMLNRHS